MSVLKENWKKKLFTYVFSFLKKILRFLNINFLFFSSSFFLVFVIMFFISLFLGLELDYIVNLIKVFLVVFACLIIVFYFYIFYIDKKWSKFNFLQDSKFVKKINFIGSSVALSFFVWSSFYFNKVKSLFLVIADIEIVMREVIIGVVYCCFLFFIYLLVIVLALLFVIFFDDKLEKSEFVKKHSYVLSMFYFFVVLFVMFIIVGINEELSEFILVFVQEYIGYIYGVSLLFLHLNCLFGFFRERFLNELK